MDRHFVLEAVDRYIVVMCKVINDDFFVYGSMIQYSQTPGFVS